MNVDAVCEKLKQIEGLDQSMLPQYCATIKKVMYTYIYLLAWGEVRVWNTGSVESEHFMFSLLKMGPLLKWENQMEMET